MVSNEGREAPTTMNRRNATPYLNGPSLVVTLPMDWVRGNGVKPGTPLIVEYADAVTFKIAKIAKPRPEGP